MAISTNYCIQIFIIFLQIILQPKTANADSDYDTIKDDITIDESNFPEFKQFGQKKSTLLDSLAKQKPLEVSLFLNQNLEHVFEHNLISPSLPEVSLLPKSTVRYTSIPTETYQVTEDVFEPKPIPQISIPKPVMGAKVPLTLGSGSLGFAKLRNGKYALGSGSLGYSRPVEHNYINMHDLHEFPKKEAYGGLHVVPAPRLGSNEAFDAAFNNFDFKPLSDFFDHK